MKLMLDPKCKRDHKSVKIGTTRKLIRKGETFEVEDREGYALLGHDQDIVDADKSKSRSRSNTKHVEEAKTDKVEAQIKEK